MRDTGALCLSGGVAANRALREALTKRCDEEGVSFFIPPMELCTDNAMMIGCAGYYRLMNGEVADLSLNADPSMRLA
jgi:N6-L-threonylcarbamoyladenine synthase